MKSKILFGPVVLLLLAVFSGCYVMDPWEEHQGNMEASSDFNFRVSVDQRSRLYLDGINGPVCIVGEAGLDEVQIWGRRIVCSDSRTDAREALNDLEVHIYESSSAVSIETEQPGQTYGREYKVEYFVRLPLDWRVSVDLVNGTLTLDSLNNRFDFDVTNGNVDFTAVRGRVNGDLVNGNIEGIMTLPAGGECELDLVNGQITLKLPAATSADLAARVVNGRVSVSGFDLNGFDVSPKAVTGVLGDGDGRISLETTNGNINVMAR